ncbi:tetratricopeptide repeat protein [Vibrio sp. D420a]|jgi:GGDEF domain-containing protein|uniref:tetratricopeptide repeat protein n=1 Tax=unclassified Vibrio TaxID=2614977 RepID=UPI001268FC8B|nr:MULTISPECIES: tetratricopeptide repeat protein [unclassified Vibrio]MDK9762251.1 tetratricopeptide repeat protein [Vibrio sp. D420a]QFT10584.1 Tetratricopeptide repeat protein [Vibrio sp. THAF190c]
MRWLTFIGLLLVSLSASVSASVYSSALLNEANNLVEIEPSRAKQMANSYLTLRVLSDQSEKSPSAISREETDSSIRTPNSSIDAYKILAKAEFNLGHTRTAIQHIETASELAKTYKLQYLELDLEILKTRLLWLNNRKSAEAKEVLTSIEASLQSISQTLRLTEGITYRLIMLKAEIASYENQIDEAESLYQRAKAFLDQRYSEKVTIDYHIAVGEFYLTHKEYNHALSELLYGYWKSVEGNLSARLAKVNRLLAQLFFERQVLDKAVEHLSQAADFYDNFENSPILAQVLKKMGDVYYFQGKYNLALVHFFNVLDHESTDRDINQVIDIRLSLSATYLRLYNYPLAEQYLSRALELLEYTDNLKLEGRAALLSAGLAYHLQDSDQVIKYAQRALDISRQVENMRLSQRSYHLLSLGYEQAQQPQKALENLKQYTSLISLEQQNLNRISEDAFRQQKEFAERTLHYAGQAEELELYKEEHRKFQKISFALFLFSIILFFFVLRRGYIIQSQVRENDRLSTDLFTHSRSKLPNLRMLNAKLSNSLEQTSQTFEQWQLGELIHEPLNDRLRFVMIDLPFLRNMYTQNGYKAGLELEDAFGEYLKTKLDGPSRIYHFSDANLLYIEPNSDRDASPEAMFRKIQSWISDFEPERNMNRTIRVGIADYPFLPRAYTAINDQELLDVLLMSTNIAREVSLKERSSQWVYLKAIDNAPAASLATGNIREACKIAINQGLIKIQSSYQNEDNIKKMLKDE